MIRFREAVPGDGVMIAHTRQKCWDATYRGIYPDEAIDQFDYEWHTDREERLMLRPDFHSNLVLEGEACVGYYSWQEIPEGIYRDFRCRICSVYLLPQYQSRGIGRRILETVFDEVRKKGYGKLYLECSQHNLGAQSFYIRMGGIIHAIDGGHENKQEDTCYFEFQL